MGFLADFILKWRGNRKILLFIVYVALFLDNMLLTTVVPIIPEYLFHLEHPNVTNEALYKKPYQHFAGRHGASYYIKPPPSTIAPRITTIDSQFFAYTGVIPSDNTTPAFSSDVPPTNATKNEFDNELRHKLLTEENVKVGLMFGFKALVQLITNPFIGPLTNKIGYTIPMFVGFCVMFLSTILFAFAESYGMLFFARALQGIGSACTSTSGMGMLAMAYPNDKERGSAMGIALGGLALGVLIGPPFGGILFEWAGKALPFMILAMLALADGALQFLVLQPHVDKGEPEGSSMKTLAKDPYIIVAAGSITIGNLGIAMLEPSLPLWMMMTMQARSSTRGAAFLPASISYLIGTNIFGPLAHKIGRWLSGLIGLVTIGFCLIAIPSAKGIGGLILPNGFMGFAIGMIDASMFPEMGNLVDLRHVGVYGSIYAIADAAFCFAFAFGPFFSGPLVRRFGFPTMMYIIAAINFLYAPLMFFLRKPPPIGPGPLAQEATETSASMIKGDHQGVQPYGTINEQAPMEPYNPNNAWGDAPTPNDPTNAWGD